MTRAELISKLKEEYGRLSLPTQRGGSNAYLVVAFPRKEQTTWQLLGGDCPESELFSELHKMLERGGKAIGLVGYRISETNEISVHSRLFPKYKHVEYSTSAAAVLIVEAREFVRAFIQPVHQVSDSLPFTRSRTQSQLRSGAKLPLTSEEQESMRIAIEKAGGYSILRGQTCFERARNLSLVPSVPPILYHEGVVWNEPFLHHRAWVTYCGKIYDPFFNAELTSEYFGVWIPRVSQTISPVLSAAQVHKLEEFARDELRWWGGL
jgi:hypothetical protein